MTNKEAVKVIQEHLDHWKRLLAEHICEKQEGEETIEAFDMAINVLKQQKVGYWIPEILGLPLSDGSIECVKCSNCRCHFDFISNFCPNCGAKMEDE